MALGARIGLAAMMPYWMMTLAAIIKPHLTILFLGLPEVVGEVEIEEHRTPLITEGASAPPSSACQMLWTVILREAGGLLFLSMFMVSCVALSCELGSVALSETLTLQSKAEDMLLLLATMPAVVTMLNMVCITGLYGQTGADADQMLAPKDGLFGAEGPIVLWVFGDLEAEKQRPVQSIALALLLTVPGFAFDGWCSHLDTEALSRMPSAAQRLLVRVSWVLFKPVYHVLKLVALPAMIAYFWMVVVVFLGGAFVGVISTGLVLPMAFRLRERLLGRPQPDITCIKDGLVNYFAAPCMFAILLTVFIPLSLRLFAGDGYLSALWHTWDDRHAVTYFSTLAEDLNSTAVEWRDKAATLNNLIFPFL
mmetsp:Transcript_90062/g.173328  ORF Transcript_90062/g.173328 Transcript_90062/m.173328 type:complete len:366 (-) Transcript_90062:28-1125(-)